MDINISETDLVGMTITYEGYDCVDFRQVTRLLDYENERNKWVIRKPIVTRQSTNTADKNLPGQNDVMVYNADNTQSTQNSRSPTPADRTRNGKLASFNKLNRH